MKIFHHFHTIQRCNFGLDDLSNQFFYPWSPNSPTSCPNNLDPARFDSLSGVLWDMMVPSNNSSTEAIRQRYGPEALDSTIANIGAEDTEINHTHGCLCSSTTPNQSTLEDLAMVFERVRLNWLGNLRDSFYALHDQQLQKLQRDQRCRACCIVTLRG